MASFISNEVLDQIRQGNDLVDIIGSYLPIKKTGVNFRLLCPFHKEKTPSFHINSQKQIWHCFGCGVGGDVFTFIMKYEGLDFLHAAHQLADRAGIRLEYEKSPIAKERSIDKDALWKLHEDVAQYYHEILLNDKSANSARDYLKKRGIENDTVRDWRIGYALPSWDGLVRWARKNRMMLTVLEEGGLLLKSESESGDRKLYDRFRGRLMFPIRDDQGRTIGFSGRILEDITEQPKYVNSPETLIFKKGKVFFGFDRAKRSILDIGTAIVCEGQLDTITCHTAGLTNVVAPQGTALTEYHARVLKRFADEVVLLFDSDEAGQRAVVRSAAELYNVGLVVRVALLPEKHDPDSFVKQFGLVAIKRLINESDSYPTYLLNRLCKKNDATSDVGKLRITRSMVELLSKVTNAVLRSSYIKLTASRLQITEASILEELRKFRQTNRQRIVGSSSDQLLSLNEGQTPLVAEEILLRVMLTNEQMIKVISDKIDPEWLTESIAGRFILKILEWIEAGSWTGAHSLFNSTEDEKKTQYLSHILCTAYDLQYDSNLVDDCVRALERDWVEHRWRDIRFQLSRPGVSPTEMLRFQKEVLDLRRKLDNIAGLSMDKNLHPQLRENQFEKPAT